MEFKDLKIKDNLLASLLSKGFTRPTTIQQKVLPQGINGKDILAKSETGSGKTLAYVLSILNQIDDGTGRALVVAPTKELCLQIREVFEIFTKQMNLKVCTIFGGSDFTRQRLNLKTANIIIGTTGRLLDHISRRTIKLHKLKYLVLDEADEMLDMGFIEDIKKIVKASPKIRQTFMLSATFNEKVKNLAKEFLFEPEIIEISKDNKIVDGVEQCYCLCLKKGKYETLVKFLNTIYNEKAIIFVNTKKMAEELYKKLKEKEIICEYLHGDLTLKERRSSINRFKSYQGWLLIATDVASRGLDIDNVEYVINYDMPQDAETYIHRLGRTARAGKTGLSLSLINSEKQLEYLKENFSNYKLTELKVKRDDKTSQIIFVKTKTLEFDFNADKTKKNKDNKQNKNKKSKQSQNKSNSKSKRVNPATSYRNSENKKNNNRNTKNSKKTKITKNFSKSKSMKFKSK